MPVETHCQGVMADDPEHNSDGFIVYYGGNKAAAQDYVIKL